MSTDAQTDDERREEERRLGEAIAYGASDALLSQLLNEIRAEQLARRPPSSKPRPPAVPPISRRMLAHFRAALARVAHHDRLFKEQRLVVGAVTIPITLTTRSATNQETKTMATTDPRTQADAADKLKQVLKLLGADEATSADDVHAALDLLMMTAAGGPTGADDAEAEARAMASLTPSERRAVHNAGSTALGYIAMRDARNGKRPSEGPSRTFTTPHGNVTLSAREIRRCGELGARVEDYAANKAIQALARQGS